MTWHKITSPGTSTADKFFGDVTNKINGMFNGEDISDSVSIHNNVGWDFQGAKVGQKEAMEVAVSDETTDLTAGTKKITKRMPYRMLVTSVKASVGTAPVGTPLIIDVNKNGTSILDKKIYIDSNEETTVTASTTPVLASGQSTLADDDEITIDIDQIGSTTAGKGAKVYLIGYQT